MMDSDLDSEAAAIGLRAIDWDRLSVLQVVVPQHVVYRHFVSETVLLNIQTGTYYGMTGTGARLFDSMCEGKSLASIVQDAIEEFEASETRIREDLIGYCSDLMALGLIQLQYPDGRDFSIPRP